MSVRVKRYRARRRRRALLLLIPLLLGAAAFLYFRSGAPLPVFFSPVPPLTPEESAQETRMLTIPGKNWYALQLGAFEQEEPANALAASFRERGAAGYVHRQGSYRVLAAAYAARAEAQAVQTNLGALHGVEAYVSELSRGEVTLRVTGQKAQLTALEDSFAVLDQGAEQLCALSLGLDDRTETPEKVREALASQKETFGALKRRLTALFGENAPAAVTPIIQALSDVESGLAAAAALQSETALGAQTKYCQLRCILALSDYTAALTGTADEN